MTDKLPAIKPIPWLCSKPEWLLYERAFAIQQIASDPHSLGVFTPAFKTAREAADYWNAIVDRIVQADSSAAKDERIRQLEAALKMWLEFDAGDGWAFTWKDEIESARAQSVRDAARLKTKPDRP